MKFLFEYNQGLPILPNQYHGCWCRGDARSQIINNHDIDLVKPHNTYHLVQLETSLWKPPVNIFNIFN